MVPIFCNGRWYKDPLYTDLNLPNLQNEEKLETSNRPNNLRIERQYHHHKRDRHISMQI